MRNNYSGQWKTRRSRRQLVSKATEEDTWRPKGLDYQVGICSTSISITLRQYCRLDNSYLRPCQGRAETRGRPVELIIWRRDWSIFFKLLRFGTGLENNCEGTWPKYRQFSEKFFGLWKIWLYQRHISDYSRDISAPPASWMSGAPLIRPWATHDHLQPNLPKFNPHPPPQFSKPTYSVA
jgi:hypothetical protein